VYAYIFELCICLSVSSPYLLVFDDGHVIRYTRAYDVASGVDEAYSRRGTSVGKIFMEFFDFMDCNDFVNFFFLQTHNL